ncbi:M48 family metallopeptidase [Methylobacterium pseudosasicola]|uniref:Peptidase family M48 n=1 Tax=Methylobacterium pseudosasicola TaxID=582667 RepID=A0A1I4HBU9_9HYPH|nr:M48 family metallopeptidase [Methylobacterium pseudosasicola]SFL39240.1 Peptidase family M48 [Methylobacterium pseudosasicola]
MTALTGAGRYFDGRTTRPVPVSLRLEAGRLEVSGPDLRRDWNGLDLRAEDARPPLMRVGPADTPERVEFSDEALAAALEALCPDLHAGAATEGITLKVTLWSMAAGIALLGLAAFGVPVLADALAPLVPVAVEERIGAATEKQIGYLLGNPAACSAPEGQAALDRLVTELGAGLPPGLHVSVRRSTTANALTLPGARVIVLSDLIAQAQSPDEFAGVLAHEFGHVAARDPTRALIRSSGIAYLLGYLVGDLAGSAVIVALGETALSAGYSREAERAADAYSVAAMTRAGGDASALAILLDRIAADTGEDLAFMRSHPFTRDRAAAIRALAAAAPQPLEGRRPILDAPSWEALKAICAAPASR